MATRDDDRRAERWLVFVLRFAGVLLVLAWPMALLPTDVQAAWHERLGLGAFPASPLVDYLTRSISVLYGVRGIVYLALSRDVRRYLPLVRLFGWMDVLAGILLLGIDLHAGLPGWWTWSEGPGVVVGGALFLLLAARIKNGDAGH